MDNAAIPNRVVVLDGSRVVNKVLLVVVVLVVVVMDRETEEAGGDVCDGRNRQGRLDCGCKDDRIGIDVIILLVAVPDDNDGITVVGVVVLPAVSPRRVVGNKEFAARRLLRPMVESMMNRFQAKKNCDKIQGQWGICLTANVWYPYGNEKRKDWSFLLGFVFMPPKDLFWPFL